MSYTTDTKHFFNICKTLAIFLVISVHINVTYSGADLRYNNLIGYFADMGLAGVGMFFFISGYAYQYNSRKFLPMLKHKIINLLIPCYVAGFCMEILYTVILNHSPISLRILINAAGSHVGQYYFWMLFIFCIIFYFTNFYIEFFILVFALTYAVLRTFNFISPFSLASDFYNPIWWCIWFILGKWSNKFNIISKIKSMSVTLALPNLIICLLIVRYHINTQIHFIYFSTTYIIFECLMIISIMGISELILVSPLSKSALWDNIGLNTGFLCLYNFPLCAFWGHILLLSNQWYFIALSPVMIILTTLCIVKLLRLLKLPITIRKGLQTLFIIKF